MEAGKLCVVVPGPVPGGSGMVTMTLTGGYAVGGVVRTAWKQASIEAIIAVIEACIDLFTDVSTKRWSCTSLSLGSDGGTSVGVHLLLTSRGFLCLYSSNRNKGREMSQLSTNREKLVSQSRTIADRAHETNMSISPSC